MQMGTGEEHKAVIADLEQKLKKCQDELQGILLETQIRCAAPS